MLELRKHNGLTALIFIAATACSDDDAGVIHIEHTPAESSSSESSSTVGGDGGVDGGRPSDAGSSSQTPTSVTQATGDGAAAVLDAGSAGDAATDSAITPDAENVDAEGVDAGVDSAIPLEELRVNEPLALVSESADNYDANDSGIITGATLDRWITNWTDNRPSGITGRLIILQQDSREGAMQFISHDDTNVFTYGFAQHAYADSQKRNNGLLDTFVTIPDGARTDEILNQFDIDLSRDLVVFAFVDKDAVPATTVDDAAKATIPRVRFS